MSDTPPASARSGDERRAAVGEVLASADAAEAPESVLVDRMRTLTRARAQADAALVEQLRVFDARGGAAVDGQTSTLAWLRSHLRVGRDAADLMACARQLSGLPQVAKAFGEGEFSLEHAAVVAKLAGQVGVEQLAGIEATLVELAKQAPPKQLRMACQRIRQLLDPAGDGDDKDKQYRQRFLSAARTLDGLVHLNGLLDAASGDVVLAALNAAMPAPAEYEERTPDQRRADALTDIAAGWLAAGEGPTAGGVRPQVQVTISLRALQQALAAAQQPEPADPADPANSADSADSGGRGRPGKQASDGSSAAAAAHALDPLAGLPLPAGWDGAAAGQPGWQGMNPPGSLIGDVPVLGSGYPISPAQARQFACDSQVIPVVLGSDGEVLDVGRSTRVIPVGLRRALNLRDGGCRFPGCDRPASWAEAHHLRPWALGGRTSLRNLILLCCYHHRLIDKGWVLHGDPNGTVHFTRPDGRRLELSSRPRSRPPPHLQQQ